MPILCHPVSFMSGGRKRLAVVGNPTVFFALGSLLRRVSDRGLEIGERGYLGSVTVGYESLSCLNHVTVPDDHQKLLKFVDSDLAVAVPGLGVGLVKYAIAVDLAVHERIVRHRRVND